MRKKSRMLLKKFWVLVFSIRIWLIQWIDHLFQPGTITSNDPGAKVFFTSDVTLKSSDNREELQNQLIKPSETIVNSANLVRFSTDLTLSTDCFVSRNQLLPLNMPCPNSHQ